jgi:hypothetical protein
VSLVRKNLIVAESSFKADVAIAFVFAAIS